MGMMNLGSDPDVAARIQELTRDAEGNTPGMVNSKKIEAQNVALDPAMVARQQNFANALQTQMNGQGPSAASAMLQHQGQSNAANMIAAASGQRGVNPALAMRSAMDANAAANQNAGAQAATIRAQEQLAATGQLGNQLNTMQNQSFGASQANQNANLAAQQSNQRSSVAAQQGNQNFQLGLHQIGEQGREADNGNNMKILGGIMSGIGGAVGAGMGMSEGGTVPGQAKAAGDSYANDTVHTMLSPGEIVIPRSVAQSPGFIESLQKHVKSMGGDGPQGFAKVLAARKGSF